MPLPNRYRRVIGIGPVKVATYYTRHGIDRHTAACTAPGCGFSADYRDRAAAELAARTHRCSA
ncbi:mobile element transfer protein [Streptomyces sp. FT1]|uniref:mobile element transfer protein n=1 Tax=Streptomyces sp. FT1 TaxID=2871486 RepID=UPI002250CF1E|nr:mobile element transfer protein [Streptomyces sp. FT1]MCX5457090.1 Mobile element transfer [Streptomyces sp. FT1]